MGYRPFRRVDKTYVPTSVVVEAGAAALEKSTPDDQAFIQRQIVLIQQQLLYMGPVGAMELLTALGMHLAQKDSPQQVTSAAGQRRA